MGRNYTNYARQSSNHPVEDMEADILENEVIEETVEEEEVIEEKPVDIIKAETMESTTLLNLRDNPSSASSIVSLIKAGDLVKVFGKETNGFVRVQYNGHEGWCMKEFLK